MIDNNSIVAAEAKTKMNLRLLPGDKQKFTTIKNDLIARDKKVYTNSEVLMLLVEEYSLY